MLWKAYLAGKAGHMVSGWHVNFMPSGFVIFFVTFFFPGIWNLAQVFNVLDALLRAASPCFPFCFVSFTRTLAYPHTQHPSGSTVAHNCLVISPSRINLTVMRKTKKEVFWMAFLVKLCRGHHVLFYAVGVQAMTRFHSLDVCRKRQLYMWKLTSCFVLLCLNSISLRSQNWPWTQDPPASVLRF